MVAGLGKRDCQVHRCRRLALARNCAGYDDDARRMVDFEELQVGAKLTESLGAGRLGKILEVDSRMRLALLVERDCAHQGLA